MYVPGGGNVVGWMPGPKDVLGVLHVLSGRGWPRQGQSQGSALLQMNFKAFDLADVKTITNCK